MCARESLGRAFPPAGMLVGSITAAPCEGKHFAVLISLLLLTI